MKKNFKKDLIDKINNSEAKIGIIGLGYVGMPLTLNFSNRGFKVIGFDNNKEKVKNLNNFKSHLKSISANDLRKMGDNGFIATNDFSQINLLDVIILCLPTPLNKDDEPDLSFITNALDKIHPYLKKGQLLSLESTTYPGTTEEIILPKIKELNWLVGQDYFISYSPEREDPGNEVFSTRTIPKVVGGQTKNCLEVAELFYSQAINKIITVSSTRVAEMVKLHENIYRSINIGLVNEMKMICDEMNIDIYEVIKAANTKPFGFSAYYPGPGVGGQCIPIDPLYLSWKAKQILVKTQFINVASEINRGMPKWILRKFKKELNKRKINFKGLKSLFIGIAYKKNIDDIRESPSVELLKLFNHEKSVVSFHDPFVSALKLNDNILESIEITDKCIASFDVVVISTNHDDIDYDQISNSAKLILDTRGVYQDKNNKIIKA